MLSKLIPNRDQLIGIGLVNLATLTWATNMTLGRWLRTDIGPLTLAAARFLIAAFCYSVVLQRREPSERRLGQDRWPLAGMASLPCSARSSAPPISGYARTSRSAKPSPGVHAVNCSWLKS